MAEVTIPEEMEEEIPTEEETIVVDKPTEKSKVISVNFNPLDTKVTTNIDTRESFYTTDTDAWIVLNVGDMNEPTGQYSLALINKEDGSIFQRTGDIVQGVAYYKLLPNEIKHAGRWVGQAVITLANGQTTASRFSFAVSGHILDGKDVREIVIQDFQTLMAQLNSLKDVTDSELSSLLSSVAASQAEYETNNTAFESKLTELSTLIETDVVGLAVDKKYEELETTYATNLTALKTSDTSLTAQLAQKVDNKKFNLMNANSKNPLLIDTYEGSNQPTHPKVLYFKNPWNGFKYWMAYTPYAYSNARVENPSIAVSNNGIEWTVPSGLINPIVPEPSGSKVYNSDTHIVMNGNVMEVWYREVDATAGDYPQIETIKRVKTTDGKTWSSPEVLKSTSGNPTNLLSPCAIFEDGIYKIWLIEGSTVKYFESSTGLNWNAVRTLVVETDDSIYNKKWHLDVVKNNGVFEMILSVHAGVAWNGKLFYTKSTDNINYDVATCIVDKGKPGELDDAGIYRSSIVYVDNEVYVYYAAVSSKNVWTVALSKGNNVFNLKGVNSYDYKTKISASLVNIPKNGMLKINNSTITNNEITLKNQSNGGTIRLEDSGINAKFHIQDGLGKYGTLSVGNLIIKLKNADISQSPHEDGKIVWNEAMNCLEIRVNGTYIRFQMVNYGNTASRPPNGSVGYGFMYFDTQINKPIWFSTSSNWRDATGTVV